MPGAALSQAPVKEPTATKPAVIQSVQAARAVAALLVVVCHSGAFLGQVPGLWQRLPVYLWSRGTALGVQMFFVISGLVIFRTHRKDLNQPRRVGTFSWKRFRRIYPLYWISLSLTLWKHHAPTDPYPSYHLPSVIASNYLLVHLFSYQTIMVQGWTLFDEVQFYFVFALCIANRKIGLAVLSLWLTASLLFLTPATSYWLAIFSPYHLLFGLGILVALALEIPKPISAHLLFWTGTILFLGALIIAGPFNGSVVVRLVAGVGAASLLLGAALLERQRRFTIPRWLNLLGDASYSIYLVHFMVISVIARFAFAHWRSLPVPLGGWMLLFIFCGVAAGVAAHYAIERPLLNAMGKSQLRT